VFDYSPFDILPLSELVQAKETRDPRRSPDNNFHYVDIAGVSNSDFSISSTKLIKGVDAPSRARKVIRDGDIIFATTRPYLKNIAKVPVELDDQMCSTGFCVLRANEKITSDWLFFCVTSDDLMKQIIPLMRGANYPAVSDKDVFAATIPVPTVELQKQITSRIKECLERVKEIGHLRKESLTEHAYLNESLIEAKLADAKGEEVTMVDVCEITSRLIDPRDEQYQSMLHVGGANIESKTGRLIDLKTAKEERLKSGKFVFDKTMVLYNKIRPYLMKTARPDLSGLCSADMYPLEPKSEYITRDFLYYILMSRRFTSYAISGSNRAGMPKVNRKHLFDYKFQLPKIEVQQRISEHLDAAIESVQLLVQEMGDTEKETAQLRESILTKAFAGEL